MQYILAENSFFIYTKKGAYTKQSNTKLSKKSCNEGKKQSYTKQSGLRSPVGALRARRRFAAITNSKFRILSDPLLVSSQHVMFVEQKTFLGLPN